MVLTGIFIALFLECLSLDHLICSTSSRKKQGSAIANADIHSDQLLVIYSLFNDLIYMILH